MSTQLLHFLRATRQAGLRVSTAEGLDAHRVVAEIGYADRATLKEALALVMAKSQDEYRIFSESFDLFFSRGESAAPDVPMGEDLADPDAAEAAAALAGMLGGTGSGMGAGAAGLAVAIEQAATRVGVENIRYFTQVNLFTRRIMEQLGAQVLEQQIADAVARADEGLARAREQENALRRLRQMVRDFVERQLAIYARNAGTQLRDEILQNTRLANIDRRDLDRVRIMVRALAQKLAARHGMRRKRRRRGQLDVRRTVRRNMAFGGIPFTTHWKAKVVDKPRLMVLCDVSNSVSEVAAFLLVFVHSLAEAVQDVRSFAFAGGLMDVSSLIRDTKVEEAIPRILADIGPRSSDYGNAFADFDEKWMREIDRNTAIIILGDARTNGTDPRVDVLRDMQARAKRIVWLNPEYKTSWGTGDSEMLRYAPFCSTIAVCNNIRQLDRAIGDLLSDLR